MQNLEIKCRYPDLKKAERLARDVVGAQSAGLLTQTDTYFALPSGRLKLRHIQQEADGTDEYQLIHYRRGNRSTPRTSDYHILPIADGPATRTFFADSLGIKVEVVKQRLVYRKDNLRIHLDMVRQLGRFLEFELIVGPQYPLTTCRMHMAALLATFDIDRQEMIRGSYADLLLAENGRS